MKLELGQTVFAIGFQYDNDLLNCYYTVEVPHRPAVKRHYVALTVVEEKESKCGYTGEPHEEKGYILKDQFDRLWNHNYPTYDGSGRGAIFDRNTEGCSEEEVARILSEEVCAARTLDGFLQTLVLETYNLEFPKVIDKLDADLVKWLKRHKSTVLGEATRQLFVTIECVPQLNLEGKPYNSDKFVRYTVTDRKLSGTEVLTFMALFGDMMNWAQIFLGAVDFEFACASYFEATGNLPKSAADLRTAKTRDQMQTTLNAMRAHLQSLADSLSTKVEKPFILEPSHKVYRADVHHTKAATTFRAMSKPSEFGTISEICAKFGISKAEARKRKQEGTLHELME